MNIAFLSNPDLGLLVLRLGLALVFFAHGVPKLRNVAQTAGFFGQIKIPVPAFFAWVVALQETLGAAALALGLFTQPLALTFVISMIVAIQLVKIGMAKAGFTGQGGWEFEFVLAAAALALVFTGAGAYSLDVLLAR